MIEQEDLIQPPSHYDRVMSAARKLSQGKGIGSFSGEEAVDKFKSLKLEGENAIFIDACGEVTKDVKTAVAALIVEESNPSTHLYFSERFNQPSGKLKKDPLPKVFQFNLLFFHRSLNPHNPRNR